MREILKNHVPVGDLLKKPKYTTVTISDIITQIAEVTDIPGYTVGILESMLPSDDQLKAWTGREREQWITDNNNRMIIICRLLNDNNL